MIRLSREFIHIVISIPFEHKSLKAYIFPKIYLTRNLFNIRFIYYFITKSFILSSSYYAIKKKKKYFTRPRSKTKSLCNAL